MKSSSRRDLLKTLGFAIAASPLMHLRAQAADESTPDRLDENDPAAQALAYRHDVADVDVEKYPRSASQDGARPNCRGCVLFQAQASEQWAGCPIFPGKHVNAAGWCTAWAPKN